MSGCRLLVTLAGLVALSAAGSAQQPRAWELVGDSIRVDALLVSGDSAVFAFGTDGVVRVAEQPFDEWTVLADQGFSADDLYEASTGTLFANTRTLIRSQDRGRTWTFVYQDVFGVIEVPPSAPGGRALLAAVNGQGVIRSTDDGDAWSVPTPGVPPFDRLNLYAFAYAPPSPARATGIVVGVGTGGAAFSADGGRAWQASNLLAPFGLLADYAVYSEHDDTVYAVVNGPPTAGGSGDPLGNVYATRDGATWTWQGRVPAEGDESPARILAGADGVLWVTFPGRIDGPVWSSGDGCRTSRWGRRGGCGWGARRCRVRTSRGRWRARWSG